MCVKNSTRLLKENYLNWKYLYVLTLAAFKSRTTVFLVYKKL